MHKQINQTARLVLNKAAEIYDLPPRTQVSLSWVDDEYIQKLNHEYRAKNTPTDVLSFALNDPTANEAAPEIINAPKEAKLLLGDIVISLETAARQADEYGHGVLREVAYLVIHGMLHLLGYDHLEETAEKQMRQEEEYILNILDISREI